MKIYSKIRYKETHVHNCHKYYLVQKNKKMTEVPSIKKKIYIYIWFATRINLLQSK